MSTRRITVFPNKMQLAFALLEGDNIVQIPLEFRLEGNSQPEQIKVNMIQREDASGNNFIIHGYNIANKQQVRIFIGYKDHKNNQMTFIPRGV